MIFVLISVVIDLTEKMQDFLDHQAPLHAILFDYYLNFIPYIAALLGPFFIFISVIYFTSRMAYNSELVSILGNGISYYRLLRPYFYGSLILAAALWGANHWLVPEANKTRFAFEQDYVNRKIDYYTDIQLVTNKSAEGETIISMQRYMDTRQEGYRFSLKRIRNHRMTEFLYSPRINWHPEEKRWRLNNYNGWKIFPEGDSVYKGNHLDTALGFTPADFVYRVEVKSTMNMRELNRFIKEEKRKGSEKVPLWEVEKYQRTSNAFSVVILTFIGLAVSSRKYRGGMGFQLALGLLFSAAYVLFMRFSTTFATNSDMPALLAVWIPNLLFGIIAAVLVRLAPK